MRFGEIYKICKTYYYLIKQEYDKMVAQCTQFKEKKVMENISSKGVLHSILVRLEKNITMYFRNIECLQDAINKISFAISDSKTIEEQLNAVNELLIQIQCIIQLYESMGQREQGIGIDIKIPETDDITEFKKYIDGLEFVFTKCPFFQDNNARLKFNNVDVGSTWLVINAVGISVAVNNLLNNIAAFIDKCIAIKSHRLICEKQELENKKFEYDQKIKEELIDNIVSVYKTNVSNAIKELEESTGHNIQDDDERWRAEQSLEKMEKLIDKGLQIYASIDSPSETKMLFEPLEMHYLSISEELKQMEKKSDDGDKSRSAV